MMLRQRDIPRSKRKRGPRSLTPIVQAAIAVSLLFHATDGGHEQPLPVKGFSLGHGGWVLQDGSTGVTFSALKTSSIG